MYSNSIGLHILMSVLVALDGQPIISKDRFDRNFSKAENKLAKFLPIFRHSDHGPKYLMEERGKRKFCFKGFLGFKICAQKFT